MPVVKLFSAKWPLCGETVEAEDSYSAMLRRVYKPLVHTTVRIASTANNVQHH